MRIIIIDDYESDYDAERLNRLNNDKQFLKLIDKYYPKEEVCLREQAMKHYKKDELIALGIYCTCPKCSPRC